VAGLMLVGTVVDIPVAVGTWEAEAEEVTVIPLVVKSTSEMSLLQSSPPKKTQLQN